MKKRKTEINESNWMVKIQEKIYILDANMHETGKQFCRCTNKPNFKPLLTNKDYKI